LHAVYAARPNVVPIVVTTGVGPDGPKSVLHQPPSSMHPAASSPVHGDHVDVSMTGDSSPSRTFASNRTNTLSETPSKSITKSHRESKPRPSTASRMAESKLRSIQVIPQKRSMTDALVDISKYVSYPNLLYYIDTFRIGKTLNFFVSRPSRRRNERRLLF
jgi:hypothetical protein